VSQPLISVVIPAYNEEAYLPRLLDTIDAARDRFGPGRDSIEVIVADNGSTDRTVPIASSRGCTVVRVEKRAIGAVRNGGARVANGEILAFVDADTQVHPDTFTEIARCLDDPNIIGGATGIRFERTSLGIKLTFAMLVLAGNLVRLGLRERLTANVDTGVTFCRRRDFEQVKGYSEERLFAEDAQFLIDLKRLGGNRHLSRPMKAKAVFSTRKFDKHGDWHYFPLSARMIISALRPNGMTWARAYWYEDR